MNGFLHISGCFLQKILGINDQLMLVCDLTLPNVKTAVTSCVYVHSHFRQLLLYLLLSKNLKLGLQKQLSLLRLLFK